MFRSGQTVTDSDRLCNQWIIVEPERNYDELGGARCFPAATLVTSLLSDQLLFWRLRFVRFTRASGQSINAAAQGLGWKSLTKMP